MQVSFKHWTGFDSHGGYMYKIEVYYKGVYLWTYYFPTKDSMIDQIERYCTEGFKFLPVYPRS